ncbi:MAG: nuclear transport factor 2 family protein [Pseudomonadota bacterium]
MDRGRDRSNDELIRGYLSAFSTGEPTSVSAFVADNFVNEHFGMLGGGCEGKAVYEARLANFLATFQNLRYEITGLCSNEASGSARYQMHFRQDGKDFMVPGIMWFELKDGAIAKRTDCWDGLVYLKQAGTDASAVAAMLAP